MINTIFLGSNWQSVKILENIIKDGRFNIQACITQPDKPVGRKQVLTPTELKQYCIDNSIEVLHTENSKDKYREILDRYNPELIVCIAFGEIIPEFFLEEPKYKAINIHFSILPKYRGAVPIQMAILNGEKETGITVTRMIDKLDAGPILKIYKTNINDNDTNQTLRERLVEMSCNVLPNDLFDWCNGNLKEYEQDNSLATFCFKADISKDNAIVDFRNDDPIEIDRKIRAYIPWPLTWFMYNDKRIIIHNAKLVHGITLNPGEMKKIQSQLFIGTKESNTVFELIDIQQEGKTVIKGKEFQI